MLRWMVLATDIHTNYTLWFFPNNVCILATKQDIELLFSYFVSPLSITYARLKLTYPQMISGEMDFQKLPNTTLSMTKRPSGSTASKILFF